MSHPVYSHVQFREWEWWVIIVCMYICLVSFVSIPWLPLKKIGCMYICLVSSLLFFIFSSWNLSDSSQVPNLREYQHQCQRVERLGLRYLRGRKRWEDAGEKRSGPLFVEATDRLLQGFTLTRHISFCFKDNSAFCEHWFLFLKDSRGLSYNVEDEFEEVCFVGSSCATRGFLHVNIVKLWIFSWGVRLLHFWRPTHILFRLRNILLSVSIDFF